MESLWPQFEEVTVNIPYKILQEQATLFNEQMQGLLTCNVEKGKYQKNDYIRFRDYDYEASMYISSPNLPDYRLQLIEVYFSVSKAYPCGVLNCLEEFVNETTADNAEEFKNTLKNIFHSEKVVRALQNIATQSQL